MRMIPETPSKLGAMWRIGLGIVTFLVFMAVPASASLGAGLDPTLDGDASLMLFLTVGTIFLHHVHHRHGQSRGRWSS